MQRGLGLPARLTLWLVSSERLYSRKVAMPARATLLLPGGPPRTAPRLPPLAPSLNLPTQTLVFEEGEDKRGTVSAS